MRHKNSDIKCSSVNEIVYERPQVTHIVPTVGTTNSIAVCREQILNSRPNDVSSLCVKGRNTRSDDVMGQLCQIRQNVLNLAAGSLLRFCKKIA